ncbi:ribosome recycling factor [Candidatus Roizmanbacteria bacterium CG22_combo_CG10-13_8_21_14_all_35_9]|uniref:Ribosome recycling factor n=3 Tax=Candidatus Roizmaniibacteriota TaxID=1752723 RepID=A0A2H0BZW8_9BACT|nr:MAG: ribosome recycling factor [Candidatus Roizmanbacteria bacterium CG23_combo_of_CG06-09_8_20_14_all_35_49]PIP63079.1 MAG: ribosome recycling factor [Candidatus Roizmanbacteria bacterium CG22_combo_CG10-13_8_21_14_all_35_9]PIY70830.1 MAG: ribosome recycling factor [Candidatus Roizmanbacteria bacterium CG_4_10_14_0_8_um_filter_35_28]PJC82477.1 MAG: ribosome recycling factor [Candidatus Roizmanbacteria bacterium CG_4_8_14_3_um_filter_35_14]
MDLILQFKQNAQKVIDSLKENLKSIRTGRANPSLIENLLVETYGGSTKLRLMELSTITTSGPSLLVIAPFDPSILADIEKAILKSPLSLSPAVQGNQIIITIPPLSAEQRDKFVKLIGSTVEQKKVNIRNQRDDIRKKIKTQFENKEISEDEKFRLEKEVDNISQRFMEEIETIKEKKINEVLEV